MPKILVVDDEAALRTLYTEELTEEGYEVVATDDCKGLMGILDEQRPDVIVLDIRMGEDDGLELLQDIRRNFYDLPVILCTAYSSFKHDLKAIAADYYVVKCADLAELKARIRMALEGRIEAFEGKDEEKKGQGDEGIQDLIGG